MTMVPERRRASDVSDVETNPPWRPAICVACWNRASNEPFFTSREIVASLMILGPIAGRPVSRPVAPLDSAAGTGTATAPPATAVSGPANAPIRAFGAAVPPATAGPLAAWFPAPHAAPNRPATTRNATDEAATTVRLLIRTTSTRAQRLDGDGDPGVPGARSYL